MRRALLAFGAALMILCPAAIAAALPSQDEGLVADDVAEFGVFIEEGVEDAYGITLDIDAIDRAVAEVRAGGQDGGLVILSADATDHASLEAFTDATFAELNRRGAAVDTLVVVTPDETWAVTGSTSGSVDAALEGSSAAFFAGDFADGYRAFFAAVEPTEVRTNTDRRDRGSGRRERHRLRRRDRLVPAGAADRRPRSHRIPVLAIATRQAAAGRARHGHGACRVG